MQAGFRTWIMLGGAALVLAGCGGGGTEPPPPPPPPPVASVTVSPSSVSIQATKTTTLTATPKDASGNPVSVAVSWSSDNPSVATVSNGVVTGVSMGTARISATADGKSGSATITVTRQLFDHVFIVVLENRDYANVLGNPALPYLNQLAQQYALVPQFYANQHPSVGNYLTMTTGDSITDNGSFSGTITQDNVVRRLLAAGKTWKSYAEDIPSAGYTGGDQGLYARRHNPFAWFTDVKDDATQRMNLRPFSEFAGDLAANRLPDYVFLVPNLCNDGHDCADSFVNTWLQAHVAPLIQSSAFANSLLILTYDEDESTTTHGGGRIVHILISPRAKKVTQQAQPYYQFESTLRLSLEALGVHTFPGRAASAPSMWEFFSR